MSEGMGGSLTRRMGRLVRKEVSTILRDRRTVFTLVLMPLLLYPLLSIAFHQFLLAHALDVHPDEGYRLGFRSREEEARVVAQIELGELLLARRFGQTGAAKDRPRIPAWKQLSWKYGTFDDLDEAVRTGELDLGVRVPAAVMRPSPPPYLCEMLFLKRSVRGQEFKEYIEGCLAAANIAQMSEVMRRHRDFVMVLDPRSTPLDQPEAKQSRSLPVLVPLILILMTITGAVYPAIDLTAGERERGTLEILVAAPIPRLGLLFAKYLSVVTVAVLTAVVNLVAMTATLLLTPGLQQLVFQAGLPALAVLQVFFLLLLFAGFFSAVLLAVTSFARSFKEAQAYLIPLMLLSLTPGILSLMPAVRLQGPMVVVPLLNIVLLARDLLDGQAVPLTAILVVLTTLIYAAAAIGLAARIFGAEAVLYNEQAAWSDLFRRPRSPRPAPALSSALFCLALMFPALFVLSNLPGQLGGMTPAAELVWTVLTSVFLFVCLPLSSAWLRRVRVQTGFRLESLGVRAWGPAVLLGLCLWPFAEMIRHGLHSLKLGTFTEQAPHGLAELLQQWRQVPVAAIVVCYAVVPAVLEEFFFRGYLFSALRSAGTARTAIVGSAIFFGLFHLIGPLVLVERGVISTLLGLLLGWLSWRAGSIVPGMILHVLHNSSLMLLAYYNPPFIEKLGPGLLVLVGGAVCALAAAWLALACRGRSEPAAALVPLGGER
jgi:ABC-2 type transport system permease protein/sodium transport system permease protein